MDESAGHNNNLPAWLAVILLGGSFAHELKTFFETIGIQPVFLRPALVVFVLFSIRNTVLAKITNPSVVDKQAAPAALETLTSSPGKKEDADLICARMEENHVVYLTGESGVGKSHLLATSVIPELRRREPKRLVAVVRSYAGDWEDGLERTLFDQIAKALEDKGSTIVREPAEPLVDYLSRVRRANHHASLLVFDEFDQYILTHYKLLHKDGSGEQLSREELFARNRVWAALRSLVEKKAIRILFVARDRQGSSYFTFAFPGPSAAYELHRLTRKDAADLVATVEAGGFVKNPKNGWLQLRERLLDDIAPEGSVLPVQLGMALRGLTTLRALTLGDYRGAGGANGVIRAYVDEQTKQAAQQALIPYSSLADILQHLLGDTLGEVPALPTSRIMPPDGSASTWPTIAQVDAALQLLVAARIVRTYRNEQGEDVWSLYHGYLTPSVRDMQLKARRMELFLRDKQERYSGASGGVWGKYWALLSPLDLVAILRNPLSRPRALGPDRRYVAVSLVRWWPVIGLPVLYVLATDANVDLPGGTKIRTWLDDRNWSLMRPAPSIPGLLTSTREALNDQSGALGNLWNRREWKNPNSWYGEFSYDDLTGPIDKRKTPEADRWTHTQATACLIRALATVGDRDAQLAESMEAFDPLFLPENRGTLDAKTGDWYGLPTRTKGNPPSPFPRVETQLWCLSALANGYLAVHDNSLRKRLTDWAAELGTVLHFYRRPDGSWTTYPLQTEGPSSAYATALACTMLLDFAAAHLDVSIDGETRDVALRKGLDWLTRAYDKAGLGWPAGESTKTFPGLNYQVMSVFLRASAMGVYALDSSFVQDIGTTIERSDEAADDDEETAREKRLGSNAVLAPTVKGGPFIYANPDQLTGFNRREWHIELLARWVICESKPEPTVPDNLRWAVLKRLSDLLKDKTALESDEADLTFHDSELCYVLSTALIALESAQAASHPKAPATAVASAR